VWAGLGVLLLLGTEVPGVLTHVGMEMAAAQSPEVRARGLAWLRAVSSRDQMLRLCYGRNHGINLTGVVLNAVAPVGPGEARMIFFRVTGTPYNAFPAPPQGAARRFAFGDDFDGDRGGAVVARRVEGLSLASSQIDGVVDAGGAAAYLEWTLLFRNTSRVQQEARAQVALPPGAAVSRLTLWVNGEPREAAFAGSGQVRQAYDSVVHQRRDPVLVTAAGHDRVLVQCFPVPPDGGEMKVRLGITAPLALPDLERAVLRLPGFPERNFEVPAGTRHDVWLESRRPLAATLHGLQAEPPGAGRHVLRGPAADEELADPAAVVRVENARPAARCRAADPRSTDHLIVQEVREAEAAPEKCLVVVLDGAAGMADHLDAITTALATVPAGLDLRLLAASDWVLDLSEVKGASDLGRRLRQVCGAGGYDNVPALVQAWDLASDAGGGAVVWVHTAQPVVLEPLEPLQQRLRRRPDAVRFHDVPVGAGPNRILEQLGDAPAVQTLTRSGELGQDLRRLFAALAGQARTIQVTRQRVPAGGGADGQTPEASAHVARLWAFGEVLHLLEEGGPAGRTEAARLAADYQLVTPVTGAVVLETQQQYDRAGLKPVDPGTVPADLDPAGPKRFGSAPEPAMWMLLAVAAAVLGVELYRRRVRWRAA
jgi:hypothetical protein